MKLTRTLVFCLLAVLLSWTAKAIDQDKADSLSYVISSNAPDTTKVKAYIKLGEMFYKSAPQMADSIFTSGLKFAQSIDDKKGQAELLINTGWLLMNKGDIDSSIWNFRKALEFRGLLEDKRGRASCFNMLGQAYYQKGEIEYTLEYFKKSLGIYEKLRDDRGIDECLNNLGVIYYRQSIYDSSLHYLFLCIDIQKKIEAETNKPYVRMGRTLNNIAVLYRDNKNWAEAKKYYRLSINKNIALGDSVSASKAIGNLGMVCLDEGFIDSAYYFFNQALEFNLRFNQNKSVGFNYFNLAKVYDAEQKQDSALLYLQKSLKVRENIDDRRGVAETCAELSRLMLLNGNKAKAMEYAEKADAMTKMISASMHYTKTMKQTARALSHSYFTMGKIKEGMEAFELYQTMHDSMANVKRTQRFNIVALENERKQSALKREADKKLYNTVGVFLALLILITIGIMIFIIRNNRRIKRGKEKVEQFSLLLEEQKNNLESSIKYAERIQKSILPNQEMLDRVFPQNFIWLLPRDVVSGDFYWIEQKGDQFWFAVSDCTGHGVPGAFMSIVGYNGLEKALDINKLEKPSDILDDLNKNVLNTIHQDDRQMAVQDGMDIALCCVNLKTLKLDFSGANNAMYLVRKGELSQINADRQPIGYYIEERRQPFTNHEIQLEEGDIIYLFSDGYPDQFGGSRGKKFKYRPFKKLLEGMYDLPMPQQKEKLKKTIQEWMGNEEQIDDICIIGVRI